MRQATVADVFAGADGNGVRVPFAAVKRGEASPMVICAGKQMSLWTYRFPSSMARSRPMSSETACAPWRANDADMSRENACEVFGTRMVLMRRSTLT